MKINEKFELTYCKDGTTIKVRDKENNTTAIVYSNTSPAEFEKLLEFYKNAKAYAPIDRPLMCSNEELERILKGMVEETAVTCPTPTDPTEIVLKGLQGLLKFFKEFQFEPNFRFVNSLSLALGNSTNKAKTYVKNYFELIDSPYTKEINEKMKSPEFDTILAQISETPTKKTINNRFKLYYGSQGTGKTTIAMGETDNRCMVCNSSMLPSDLMEDFTFESGKATFKPSALWRSMVEGKAIVLDEINLLPFDSLRFLQTILDGKKEFLYKGNTVEIADGFKIIGTMNLTVNGMTYGLPEPLIDRAETMQKFSLTAKDLISAII